LISEYFDVKIRVIFPRITKPLPEKDNAQINAVGNFNYEPPKTVASTSDVIADNDIFIPKTNKEKVENLKNTLSDLENKFEKILKYINKKCKHIVLEYDPNLTKNEALAAAEAELFGYASGAITYDMYEQTVRFQEKIDRYISHLSIENNGRLESVA